MANNTSLPSPTDPLDADRKFTITGKVINDLTNGNWVNPTIIIKVPSVIEITSKSASTVVSQSTGYVSDRIDFSISKLNNSGGFTYYQLSALGSYKMNTNPFSASPQVPVDNTLESISINFRVNPGANEGTYRISEMWYGGEGMNAIYRGANVRPESTFYSTKADYFTDNMKNEIGLSGDVRGYKFVKTVPNSSTNYFSIVQWPNVTPSVSAKSDANNQNEPFVVVDKFAIHKNGVVAVKLSVKNDGNTIINNLRLHNIINYVDNHQINLDPLAEMQLLSVNSDRGTIYYSTQAVTENNQYSNQDLSYWTTNDLYTKGFSTTVPNQENMKSVKQLFITLDTLSQNSTYEVILNFKISNIDNITTYNQFVYSYRAPLSSSNPTKFVSSAVEFSTQVNQINYDSGTLDDVSNMPNSHSLIRPLTGTSSIPVSSTVPTRLGYNFIGWKYKDSSTLYGSSGNLIRDFEFAQESENTVELVAQWEKKSILVEFSSNYGDNPEKVSFNVLYNNEYSIPSGSTFSRVGYQFAGWTEDGNGLEPKLTGTTKLANYTGSTQKYYAQWTPNSQNVTIKHFDGDLSPKFLTVLYDNTIPSSELNVNREGYSFSFWLIEGTNEVFLPGVTKINDDITLVGQWTGNEMTIRFRSGEGMGFKNDLVFDFGSTVYIPEAQPEMSLTGHTFSGWNTKVDGSGDTIYQGVNNFDDYEEVVMLYAQWEPIEIIISLYSHPSETIVGTLSYLYGSPIILPNQGTHEFRTGYTFEKWYINSSLSGSSFD